MEVTMIYRLVLVMDAAKAEELAAEEKTADADGIQWTLRDYGSVESFEKIEGTLTWVAASDL